METNRKNRTTNPKVPPTGEFLVQRLMLNRIGQDILQHNIRSRQNLLLRKSGIVCEIRRLERKHSINNEPHRNKTQHTHSSRPKVSLASHKAAAEINDGTTATNLHSKHPISIRYFAIVLAFVSEWSALLPLLSQFIGPGDLKSQFRVLRIYRSAFRMSSAVYCLSARATISATEGA